MNAISQSNSTGIDTTLNNLILSKGQKITEYGSVPQYTKAGNRKTTLILIPGWGFDGTVFQDFVKANRRKYRIYTVTIPGFGGTPCPPVPKEGSSFGNQDWNSSVIEGILKLIEQENLYRPILVGHFTQGTQLALRLAIEYPKKVGGVIILGGVAKFITAQGGKIMDYPLKSMTNYVDKVSAPKFYKMVTKNYWDQNNYSRELYSMNSDLADKLWKQSASVPMQIMIRYLLEFYASDVTTDIDKIQCQVLILRPGFKPEWLSEEALRNDSMSYFKIQFVDSWEPLRSNNHIEIVDIQKSSTFVWKDQPEKTYKRINEFVDRLNSTQHP